MGDQGVYRTALYYGTLGGIAIFIFYIVLYISNLNVFGPVSMLGIWIPVVFLVKATRFHRDHNLSGIMTYRQGLSIGFFTTAFYVILFGLAFYLFGVLYAGDLVEMYRTAALASEKAGREVFSESIIDQTMESIELVNMATLAYSQAFLKLVGGILITLITAAIFCRSRQTTNPL
jgi:hypothetical protein